MNRQHTFRTYLRVAIVLGLLCLGLAAMLDEPVATTADKAAATFIDHVGTLTQEPGAPNGKLL